MSTYYYTQIYTRLRVEEGEPNTNEWQLVDSGCVNIYKNLLCGWEPPFDSTCVSNALDKKAKTYYTYEFIGLFDRELFRKYYKGEPLANFDKDHDYCITRKDCEHILLVDDNGNPIVFEDEEYKDLKGMIDIVKSPEDADDPSHQSIIYDDFENMSIEEKHQKYIYVYYSKKNEKNGSFYGPSSFYEYKEQLERELDEVNKKEFLWNNMQQSLDYLKLSNEEQENVASNFDYLKEDKEDIMGKIAACNYFITLSQWFDDDRSYDYEEGGWRGRDVLFYIYTR